MGDMGVDLWPELRSYVMSRGGMGRGDWSLDLVPGGLYRRRGIAPDVLAVEMPVECPEARGLWAPEDGSERMLVVLTAAYEAHRVLRDQQVRGRGQVARQLVRGRRRLSDHLDRLAERWGPELDLSAIGEAGEEIAGLYESGERVELLVGGVRRKVTVGCTSQKRPEFCYLLSIPVLEVDAA